MNRTYRVFLQLAKWPFGKRIFSYMVSTKAPYFKTIRPLITDLSPGYCTVKVRDRRAIRNHLNTVHAIAMCNIAELTGGMAFEAAMPADLRWIPKKMTVEYLKKAHGDLIGTSCFDAGGVFPGEFIVPVEVTNPDGQCVFRADITMHVTPKAS